jgi:hypothetical protein
MSFISPALISKIYQALGQNKGSEAIGLLRQHSFDVQPEHEELMHAVLRLADECYYRGDLSRAEDHYKLGLALYETCFSYNHADALRCSSGLVNIYCQKKNSFVQLSDAIATSERICRALRDEHFRPKAVAG